MVLSSLPKGLRSGIDVRGNIIFASEHKYFSDSSVVLIIFAGEAEKGTRGG